MTSRADIDSLSDSGCSVDTSSPSADNNVRVPTDGREDELG